MMRVHQPSRPSQNPDLVLVWALADGARCTLTPRSGVVELQLVIDGLVLRQAHFVHISPAYETAQQWRVDYEVERESRRELDSRTCCPECGDETFSERPSGNGVRWFCCRACGDVWFACEPDSRREH